MVSNAITLSFQTIECEGCKVWRPRATKCADCGADPKPFEVQTDVLRRTQIVKECLDADRTADRANNDWAESLTSMPRILGRINKALQRAAVLKAGSEQILYAFAELDAQINSWADRRPRPDTNRARVFHRSLIQLRDGYAIFLRALAAPDPSKAQQLERAGQELLDSASTTIGELETLNDAQTALELPLHELFGHIAHQTRVADGLSDERSVLDGFVDLDDPATADVVTPAVRQMLLTFLDLEQGLGVARATTDLLGNQSALYGESVWLREHSRTTSLLSASAYALARMDDDTTDFESVKLLLELAKDCREGFIRHALATILATDIHSYDLLTRSSTGSVIKRAATKHPALLLDENLAPYVRHAVAHADFDWLEGHFVTHPNGAELRVDEESFLDDCLGYLQCAASLLLGVHHHAQITGARIEADSHLSKSDREAALTIGLNYVGFQAVLARHKGSAVTIQAQGEVSSFVMLAGCVAAVASDTDERLEASLLGPDGVTHFCTTDLQTIREFGLTDATDDHDLVMRAARLMRDQRIDDECPWSEANWLEAAFAVSTRSDSESLVEPIRRVRQIKQLAIESGAPVGDETWADILAYLRRGQVGVQAAIPEAFRRLK